METKQQLIQSRKFYFKLELLYDKYSPFIISFIIVIYHTLRFLSTTDFEWIEYVCLPSLFTSLHMYNSRETFMFCKVHRCFVNYVVGNVLACLIEHYWIDPYMNVYWFSFFMIATTFVMLLALYYYTNKGETD